VFALSAFCTRYADANIVTFDAIPIGTQYGDAVADSPGDIVLTEDGITMSVEYYHVSGSTLFGNGIIDPAIPEFGQNHVLELASLDVRFDFSGTPSAPSTVRFDYFDTMLNDENLQVNGWTIWEPQYFSDLHGVEVAPGVTCYVNATMIGINEVGTVILAGPVLDVQVGGQELMIDRVRIEQEEEPCHDCDYEVTHDLEPVGSVWGGPHGDAVGDVAFTEDGIPVILRNFRHSGGGTSFDECMIETATSEFGVVQTMRFNNIDVAYDINALGIPVQAVFFLFASHGGEENIKVNNGAMHIGDIESAPTNIAPGISYYVLNLHTVTGGVAGMGVLLGDVQRLVLGGQEFWADEVCVIEDETGEECDLLVDFESQVPGTVWGAAYGDTPGDVIFTESGIPVGLDVITYSDMTTNFIEARIDVGPAPCLDNNTMSLNNIATTYDIAAAGEHVVLVLFDYYDAGGMENLQVNGAPVYIGDLASAPTNIAPGVTCTVNWVPDGFDVCGQVILYGNVQHLLVAGQEFHMDNLCVITTDEGSGSAECDIELEFEDEPLGSSWGVANSNVPGDLIFSEDGVPVTIEELFDGTSWVFWNCSIGLADPTTGVTDGQALHYGAVATEFDFTGLAEPVAEVHFEYVDWAGTENLGVNGTTIYYGQMASFPTNIAPGVTCSIDSWTIPSGESAGRVSLYGPVEILRVGGQQFMLDNICIILDSNDSVEMPLIATEQILRPPFPNPCNPKTTVNFNLPRTSAVRLSIHDIAGHEVAVLLSGEREAGSHSVVWEGRDQAGRALPSGVYFARIDAGGRIEAQKVVLLK